MKQNIKLDIPELQKITFESLQFSMTKWCTESVMQQKLIKQLPNQFMHASMLQNA